MDENLRVLHLTLTAVPFYLMESGAKDIEYRRPSEWIKSRLEGKEYDVVKFVNGYGNDKPYFIAKYNGFKIAKQICTLQYYPSGLHISVMPGDYMISIGEIIESGNL